MSDWAHIRQREEQAERIIHTYTRISETSKGAILLRFTLYVTHSLQCFSLMAIFNNNVQNQLYPPNLNKPPPL